jgi:hypothetical protein
LLSVGHRKVHYKAGVHRSVKYIDMVHTNPLRLQLH